MNKRFALILNVLFIVVLSLTISGCAAAPTEAPANVPPLNQDQVNVVPEATQEPTETVSDVVEQPADLNVAYAAMLGSMEDFNFVKPDALNAMIVAGSQPFLLDVRQPEEIAKDGYIEGAINIPIRSLAENLDKLPSFDTPIVTYCAAGWRGAIAATMLNTLGWTEAKAISTGSFGGWKEAGFPVVTGLPPAAESLNAASPDAALVAEFAPVLASLPEGFGSAPIETLVADIEADPELIIIDVRTPEEVAETGVIPGAINIPLAQFIEMQSEWPADLDANIYLYCKQGGRSAIAYTILATNGYTNIHGLKGGFEAWVAGNNPTSKNN